MIPLLLLSFCSQRIQSLLSHPPRPFPLGRGATSKNDEKHLYSLLLLRLPFGSSSASHIFWRGRSHDLSKKRCDALKTLHYRLFYARKRKKSPQRVAEQPLSPPLGDSPRILGFKEHLCSKLELLSKSMARI